MSLLVNLRHLATREVVCQGELSAAALEIERPDEMARANRPLRYDLRVEHFGESLLVSGTVELDLDCTCVRCLKSFRHRVRLTGPLCALALEGEEAVPLVGDCVDLTPHLREHILLEFPPHPVCRPECGGLPLQASRRRSRREPGGPASGAASPWDELNKLNL